MISFSLKYCCCFPISYRVKHKLLPGLHSPTPDFFSPVLPFPMPGAPPSFDIPVIPPALPYFDSYRSLCPWPPSLSLLKPYLSLKFQCKDYSLCRKLPDLSIWNQFLLPGVCSNNMGKAPFVVWPLGSHISLSISSPCLGSERVIFTFGSQEPSTATAQSWCKINVDWISFFLSTFTT